MRRYPPCPPCKCATSEERIIYIHAKADWDIYQLRQQHERENVKYMLITTVVSISAGTLAAFLLEMMQ